MPSPLQPLDGRAMMPHNSAWDAETIRGYHDAWNHNRRVTSRGAAREWAASIEDYRRRYGVVDGTLTLARDWPYGFSATQVDLSTLRVITTAYTGRGPIEEMAARPSRTRAGSDPNGRMPDDLYFNQHRLPPGYRADVCRCTTCVESFVRANNITWQNDGYAVSRYVAPEEDSYEWRITASAMYGYPDIPGHQRAPSRWRTLEQEQDMPFGFQDVIKNPLKYMLRRSGRVWSAEVEINDLTRDQAARVLGVERVQYSYRPDRPAIVASSDATVDAEIKVSCMRDGSGTHASMALDAYRKLKAAGAACHTNAGHHVHVDGTRLADMGTDAVDEVISAAWIVGLACAEILTPLAASGYAAHRNQSYFPRTKDDRDHSIASKYYLQGRAALHSERLWFAARDGSDHVATMEYRMPNGTVDPIRAQSHIAIALGILDFAERATVDGDDKAADLLRASRDRVSHGAVFDQEDGAKFLLEALGFSRDTRRALAMSAYTAPMTDKAKHVFESAAEFSAPLSKLEEKQPPVETPTKKTKSSKMIEDAFRAYERTTATEPSAWAAPRPSRWTIATDARDGIAALDATQDDPDQADEE